MHYITIHFVLVQFWKSGRSLFSNLLIALPADSSFTKELFGVSATSFRFLIPIVSTLEWPVDPVCHGVTSCSGFEVLTDGLLAEDGFTVVQGVEDDVFVRVRGCSYHHRIHTVS